MLWAVYGFLHSILRAALTECCRNEPMGSWKRAFLQAFFAALLLLPFIPLMDWPAEGYFYAAAAGVSVIYAMGMIIQLNLVERRHGRIYSIYMPLEAVVAATVWMALRPWQLENYLSDLPTTLAILAAFALCIAGLLRIRPADLCWQNFLLVAPIGVTYAVAGVVTKIVMPATDVLSVILAYALVNFTVMTVILGAALFIRKRPGAALMDTRMLKSGLGLGFFSMATYLTFVLSVVLAPNPGYTSILAMLLPVWLFGWHHARRREERGDPLAVIMILLGVILLAAANF